MSERRELEDTILRANAAKAFLENPELQQHFRAIEDELYARWRRTPPTDVEKLQEIRLTQHGLDLLRTRLTKPLDEGSLAESQLKTMNYQRTMENE